MSAERTKILPYKLFAIFGLVLMALSSFLPWLTASAPIFGISVSRSGLELAPEVGMFAVVFVIIGSLVVWFYEGTRRKGFMCLGMGIWMLIETLMVYVQLQDRVASFSTGGTLVWIGPGFYLLAVGVFITLVGGIVLLATKLEARPPGMHAYCRYCGAQNKSDAVFCERCGKKL